MSLMCWRLHPYQPARKNKCQLVALASIGLGVDYLKPRAMFGLLLRPRCTISATGSAIDAFRVRRVWAFPGKNSSMISRVRACACALASVNPLSSAMPERDETLLEMAVRHVAEPRAPMPSECHRVISGSRRWRVVMWPRRPCSEGGRESP
jgi:hypothetical protein